MEKLSKRKLEKIEELFRNPPMGSKTAAAQDFGVDLSLLFRWLKLSPQERIEEARSRMFFLEEVRRQGELARSKKS
ncbi:MAG: hypothetical protein LH472_13095 [Pyrinomonadaceae bacterium]|nr:hypothetical protein [Pyrinomonadaceae bacterium]